MDEEPLSGELSVVVEHRIHQLCVSHGQRSAEQRKLGKEKRFAMGSKSQEVDTAQESAGMEEELQ